MKTHWVLVVMDQFSRRIIGFAVQVTAVDGPSLCRMFNDIITDCGLPCRLSFDHDPLLDFGQWQANLRILEIQPIRSVPNVPVSHPFAERLIGTIRRKYLDHLFYWNSRDLEGKLQEYKTYFNGSRVHQGISGDIPNEKATCPESAPASLENYSWKSHCNGLFEMPIAA